jgi:hypothetical protein
MLMKLRSGTTGLSCQHDVHSAPSSTQFIAPRGRQQWITRGKARAVLPVPELDAPTPILSEGLACTYAKIPEMSRKPFGQRLSEDARIRLGILTLCNRESVRFEAQHWAGHDHVT